VPTFAESAPGVKQLHLHLLSDSTGETLDMVAKACLAQFDNVEALHHLWPMVRSEGHLDRVLDDVGRSAATSSANAGSAASMRYRCSIR
jgi:regulator of PEP synthase PpsR (kinase-PPPase family)